MASAAAGFFGSRITDSVIVDPSNAGHPIPDAGSERGGRRALALADALAENETLLVLLSGGASALMAVPADGLTLDDKRATTGQLLRAGADITALNTVRKHLSAIKGGWLAARTRGRCRALVISDVVGDDLTAIASGPTVPDPTTFGDALDVIRRFGGEQAFPRAVVARLAAGARGEPFAAETPKPGDPRLARSTTTIVGSRRDAMAGAAERAEALGYRVVRLDDAVVGEARIAAPAHVRAALARCATVGRPACVVSSGETTVRVTGGGKGGRNQEFALASCDIVAALDAPAVLGSTGTDGVDGPTDAAGAYVDTDTLAQARARHLTPSSFLDDNNAYEFFAAVGRLIHTGPTGTNVGDLQLFLLA